MKRILYFLSAFMLTLSMQSCFQEDNEVFDKPTAQRLAEKVQETKTLLESSSNGWLLQYYTGKEYSGGGYNMLMKFTDGGVDVQSDIAPADSIAHSDWDIKTDEGIVLSMDTYNTIFHYMSNPSSAAINGQEADYEFVVLRHTQDSIFVRGKKFGNEMVMTRIASDVNWKDYIEKCRKTLSLVKKRYETSDGTIVNFANNHHVYFGDDGIGKAFIPTENGLKLIEPYALGENKVDFINVTDAGLGTDGKADWTRITIPLYDSFVKGLWFFNGDEQSMSTSFLNAFSAAANNLGKPTWLSLGLVTSKIWGFYVGGDDGNKYAIFTFNYSKAANNKVTLAADGYGYQSEDGVLQGYYKSGYNRIVSLLNGTWNLTTDDEDAPSYLRFEKSTNPSEYFILYPAEIDYPFGE